MNPNQDFLKNIKIGDKVILESNNYALKTRVMSVCTIERITAVKKDIVLNNNYKFTTNDNINLSHLYSKEVEHSDDNVDMLIHYFYDKDFFDLEHFYITLGV